MSVWYWTVTWTKDPLLWDGNIVLFDGHNTYWDDEMKPSPGYTRGQLIRRGFIYIGEVSP